MLSFARNRSELAYQQPLLARVATGALAVAALVFLLVTWPQLLDASLPSPLVVLLGALWLAMISACIWMALSVRIAFIFGVDGVVSRECLGARRLAYAAMAGCTVVPEEHLNGRGPIVRGYRLTFQAMHPGIRPLQLFIQDGFPLDAAIVRRLKTVPGLSSRQLKTLEMATADPLHRQRMAQTPERAGEA